MSMGPLRMSVMAARPTTPVAHAAPWLGIRPVPDTAMRQGAFR